jgi:dephospho-CoA kinase
MINDSMVVAITGGMGCGQTMVAEFFKELGGKVINADFEAKKIVENNREVQVELKRTFGSKIFYRNGKLNRKLLGRVAFSNPARTNRLNRIVHPYLVAKILDKIEQIKAEKKSTIIAVDAALIYEINIERVFDAVVVVAAKMRNRIERIKKRDHLPEKDIIDRINMQIPIEDKIKWADFVIHNNSELDHLKEMTKKVFFKLKNSLKKNRVKL